MEDEFSQMLRIPKERVAVLIGSNGETKKKIEDETKTKLKVSSEGEIEIEGESYQTWMTRQIVKAIGRGFSPEKAMYLLDEDYIYDIIELKDFAKNENQMTRLKGRVIGSNGKTRDTIEEFTGCFISVYGKTISIIGTVLEAQNAKKAIEMLLSGAKHATVYRLLEGERKKILKKEILGGEE